MSFIRNFMEWNDGTEVPAQYYFWSGISALAAIINGQVWIHMGRYEIFPNMYVILLGPPANGKTSALRRAEKVVRAVDDITLSAQSETSEGLLRFMRDKCIKTIELNGEAVSYTPLSIYASELSNFFGKDPAGMIDMLTGIWDAGGEQYHRRTKGAGEDMLNRPNVNLLAGTTQEWITGYLKTDIVGGGFTRRVVFVNEGMTDDSVRVPWPEDTPERLRAFQNCVAYGKVLRGMKGEMKYAPGARAFYETWYNTRTIPREFDVRGYHKSKPTLLLKVATLVALSKEPKLEVSKEDLEVALALLSNTESTLTKVFSAIGRNELNGIASQALEYIILTAPKDVPGVGFAHVIEEGRLRGFLWKQAPGRECDDILKHLLLSEKVIAFNDTSRPNRVVRCLCVRASGNGIVQSSDKTPAS